MVQSYRSEIYVKEISWREYYKIIGHSDVGDNFRMLVKRFGPKLVGHQRKRL